MKYAFLSNVLDWAQVGGPQTFSRGLETLLQRHADFEYVVVRNHFKEYLQNAKADLVHVQSNMDIITTALRAHVRLIAGPNVVWQTATPELLKYDNMGAVLMLRPEQYPGKLNPSWMSKLQYWPCFVDETFFVPEKTVKDIDVLTISKSFHYPEYEVNLRKLRAGLNKLPLKYFHLAHYSAEQYRQVLNRSKILLFPSPRETGASACFALLECSMMNVPFIGLESALDPNSEEFNVRRGFSVKTIQEMLDILPDTLDAWSTLSSREWILPRFSMAAAAQRLRQIMDFAIIP